MDVDGLQDRFALKKFSFLSVRYVSLVKELTVSRFKVSEQGTFLGFFWTLLYPLLSLGILYSLFSGNIGREIPHYGVYLFAGLIMWNLFSNATTRGLGSILFMRGILKNINMPYEVPVISEVFVRFISFILELLILYAIIIVSGVGVGVEILAVPFILMLALLLILSLSFLLAVLNVFFSDVNHVWALTLNVLFFTTPVFYDPSRLIGGPFIALYNLNPVANVIVFMRDVSLFHRMPRMDLVVYTSVFVLASFAVTFFILKRMEPRIAEEL